MDVIYPKLHPLAGANMKKSKTSTSLAILATVAGTAMIAGCASAPKEEVIASINGTLINRSRRPIARVIYQECAQNPENWLPVNVALVATSQTAKFNIPKPCVDLNAFYDDGRLAGSQRGVRGKYPLEWVIE